jgi:hypothetical protein
MALGALEGEPGGHPGGHFSGDIAWGKKNQGWGLWRGSQPQGILSSQLPRIEVTRALPDTVVAMHQRHKSPLLLCLWCFLLFFLFLLISPLPILALKPLLGGVATDQDPKALCPARWERENQ